MQIYRFEVLRVDLIYSWGLATKELSGDLDDFSPGSNGIVLNKFLVEKKHRL